MNILEQVIEPLRDVDWNDTEAVHATTQPVLGGLATDRQLLRTLVLAALGDEELLSLCEHYDILDKIVLFTDPSGIRVRLHVFQPGYFDRPHNHRWTYSSRILRGRYLHRLYGDAEHAATGETWWQYGAAQESKEDSRKKQMSRDRMREVIDSLIDWKVL